MKLENTPNSKIEQILNSLSGAIGGVVLATFIYYATTMDNRSTDAATQPITTAPADPIPTNQPYCGATLTVSPDGNCPTPEN